MQYNHNLTYITTKLQDKTYSLHLKSTWSVKDIASIEREEKALKTLFATLNPPFTQIVIDVSKVKGFDSGGVVLFIDWVQRLELHYRVEIVGYSEKQKEMYQLLYRDPEPPQTLPKIGLLEKIGRGTLERLKGFMGFLSFLGLFLGALWHLLRHPSLWRPKEIVYHIKESGVNAVVIIGLTAFLVGMVIAYQGSVQLAKFGAEILIVDTVGLSITRELGPMITAIVIAGRSGSSYTAEIGAMKITDEIAAMRTMGFDPYQFLVLPRVFALMIALPLLIFFADIMGIAGGMVATYIQLDLSPTQFITRLHEVLGVEQYYLGMIKGPVFALMIALIACFRGFAVLDTTQSIGLQTTASVVNGIFMVIFLDALFSVIYTELGFDFI